MHPLRTLPLALILSGCALSLQADSISGWIPDRSHPDVQYRFKCTSGSLAIDWRNAYRSVVTLKVGIRGSGYNGEDQVVIPPGGSTTSNIDTLGCSATFFQITEKRFSLAAPEPVVPDTPPEPQKPTPALPTVSPWIPPVRLPELSPEALASIQIGMKQQEVLRRIGIPSSKLAIPEQNELVESYRYPVSPGRVGIIRFSNGTVTEVAIPERQ